MQQGKCYSLTKYLYMSDLYTKNQAEIIAELAKRTWSWIGHILKKWTDQHQQSHGKTVDYAQSTLEVVYNLGTNFLENYSSIRL